MCFNFVTTATINVYWYVGMTAKYCVSRRGITELLRFFSGLVQ